MDDKANGHVREYDFRRFIGRVVIIVCKCVDYLLAYASMSASDSRSDMMRACALSVAVSSPAGYYFRRVSARGLALKE